MFINVNTKLQTYPLDNYQPLNKMSKRSASAAFDAAEQVVQKKEGKKHSLDSDEEDSGAEEEKNNVLNVDDIEGEEEGVGGMEGEVSKYLFIATSNCLFYL